ncbi:MAG: hypothetical protein MI824_06960 [Hyphomicrobiales bacterium]|nr:hypothetical protein [Hyphomicrobiales bacterium]
MAILRSVDGKFYEIPDEELGQFEVPAEKVNELMAAMGGGEPEGPPPGEGDVEPYHHRWHRRRRYYWRNCWRNYWRNCY